MIISAKSRFALGLTLLLEGAAILRFLQIARQEMWLDECCTVLQALAPEGPWNVMRRDPNPPLYNIAACGWLHLFGVEAVTVRSLSAICGLAQIIALSAWVYVLSRSRGAALWAAGLAALTPIHIFYSQEARGYTFLWMLATFTALFLTLAVQRNQEVGGTGILPVAVELASGPTAPCPFPLPFGACGAAHSRSSVGSSA